MRIQLDRRGSGPGEFQQPEQVGFLGDSLLWVFDRSLARVTLFDMDGRVVETMLRPYQPIPKSRWSARGKWLLADGATLGRPTSDGAADSIPLVMWDREGRQSVADWIPNHGPSLERIRTSEGLEIGFPPAFDARPIVNVESGGNWFYVLHRLPADSDVGTIRIQRYSTAGERMDSIVIPYRVRSMTDSLMGWVRGRAEALVDAYRTQGGRGSLTFEAVMEGTWIPQRLPPVREALADGEGLWLQREASEAGLWERYELGGNLVYSVRLPFNFRGLASAPGFVFGWLGDSMYVPELRLYRIQVPDDSVAASGGRS